MLKNEVIKASGAIHISRKVGLLEQQLWNILLHHAFPLLTEKDIYYVPMQLIYQHWEYHREDHNNFKKACKNLIETSVEYNYIGNKGKVWGVFGMLSGAKIEDGICRFSYDPELRQYLNNPQIYAKISLLIQQRFSSKYSLALYELCTDYKKIGETPWLEVPDFRDFLGVKEGEYPLYKILNKWVIKTAIKEVNEKSDLKVELETRRTGRKISAVKFQIVIKSEAEQFEGSLSEAQRNILKRGVKQKVKRSVMLGYLKETEEEKVANALKILENTIDKENPTGLFIEAIREGWIPETKQGELF